ncbi:MAG TPA: hypothetical protein VG406_20430 [Isosphaeraceae bacterium]|jgi:hypothetical protein|nr:hypothetical protein [Isosphaeraceae bacterium]
MRVRTRIGLAAFGLALAPLLAIAGDDAATAPGPAAPAAKPHRHKWSRSGVCPICMEQAKASHGRIPMPPTTAADGCATCQQVAAGESVPPPGVAVAGAAAGAPVPVAAGAPGYATVGGPMPVSGEPMPIGVMRTNYNQGAPATNAVANMYATGMGGPFGNGGAPGYAVVGGPTPGSWGPPNPGAVPSPPLYASPGGEHPGMISRLFGFRLFSARREQRMRDAHAAIAYGPAGVPSELPATMVFGR